MSSFGLIKEQIFAALEDKYSSDKKLFQENVKKFVKLLVKSKTLNEMFQHYNILLNSHFDDTSIAKEYIEETVDYLRSLHIPEQEMLLLESFEKKSIELDPHVKAMDALVFGNKKNIKERVEAKQLLARKLITETNSSKTLDPRLKGVFLDILQRKLKSKFDNLTESEIKAITAFSEQDENAILSNYIHLIDDNIATIDEQYSAHGGTSEHFVKLKQAKEALIEMKNEKTPSLDNLERLLVLKEGFGE